MKQPLVPFMSVPDECAAAHDCGMKPHALAGCSAYVGRAVLPHWQPCGVARLCPE